MYLLRANLLLHSVLSVGKVRYVLVSITFQVNFDDFWYYGVISVN